MLISQPRILTTILFGLLVTSVDGRAEVTNAAAHGFSVKITREIAAPASRVYEVFVGQIGVWWSPAHSFSGSSKSLSIDAKPDGCFCEKLASSGGVRHMTVTYVDPGKKLRMSGGLGPLLELGVAGAMTLDFTELQGKTNLELKYNVGGYHPEGLDKWAAPVDSVLGEQLTRLKRFIETGRPEAR